MSGTTWKREANDIFLIYFDCIIYLAGLCCCGLFKKEVKTLAIIIEETCF